MNAHVHTYIHKHIGILALSCIQAYTHAHSYTHTYSCTQLHMHKSMLAHTCTLTNINKRTFKHTSSHTHMHTHSHNHTHMQKHTHISTITHRCTLTHMSTAHAQALRHTHVRPRTRMLGIGWVTRGETGMELEWSQRLVQATQNLKLETENLILRPAGAEQAPSLLLCLHALGAGSLVTPPPCSP